MGIAWQRTPEKEEDKVSNTSRLVELDVREYHRRGEDPFVAIMQTVSRLEPDDVFVLINSFEPHPLYRAMAQKGFDHAAEQLGPEHYRISFTRGQATPAAVTCDVRGLPPQDRHPLIFRTFSDLAPGAKMILVNDHDPKPLYYQMAAEMRGQFAWAYLEQGPRDWRVEITRQRESVQ